MVTMVTMATTREISDTSFTGKEFTEQAHTEMVMDIVTRDRQTLNQADLEVMVDTGMVVTDQDTRHMVVHLGHMTFRGTILTTLQAPTSVQLVISGISLVL